MRWFEDEKYQKMCEEAEKIQIEKNTKGWQEGDWVWDGEKTHIIGFDFLPIRSRELENQHYCKFAIMEDLEPKITFEQKAPHDLIKAKTGAYTIIKICNPVWLPSQEDLQEMLRSEADYKYNYTLVKAFKLFFVELDWHEHVSMSCLWLAFVMHELYHKTWNPEIEKWEEEG